MLPVTTIVGNLADDPIYNQGIGRDQREWFKKRFMLLTDSYENGNTVTHSFPVTFWGPRAKAVTPQKGDLVQVTVKIRNNNYVDQTTGMTIYQQEFVVQDFKILRKAQANRQQQSSYNAYNNAPPEYYEGSVGGYSQAHTQAPQQPPQAPQKAITPPPSESFPADSFPDDDIPF